MTYSIHFIKHLVLLLFLASTNLLLAQSTATDDLFYIDHSSPSVIDVLSNDDIDDVTFSQVQILENPMYGDIGRDPISDEIIFTPNSDFGVTVFEDSFIYRVQVGEGYSNNALVILRAEINLTCTQCIWPGDTDRNGEVNVWDVLPIGITYGATGTARDEVNTNWQGFDPIEAWGQALYGIDYQYIDCDGDGLIAADDIQAIDANYSETYEIEDELVVPFLGVGIDVWMNITPAEVEIGDTVQVEFGIGGTGTSEVNGAYGIAFSLEHNIVDNGTTQVEFYDNTVLTIGEDNTPISLGKNLGDGRFDIALSRTAPLGTSVFGLQTLGKVSIVTADLIEGKQAAANIELSIRNIRILNEYGEVYETLEVEKSVSFVNSINNPFAQTEATNVAVYPNPFTNSINNTLYVQVAEEEKQTVQQVSILNTLGALVLAKQVNLNTPTIELPINDLPAGIYLVAIKTNAGTISRKISVVR